MRTQAREVYGCVPRRRSVWPTAARLIVTAVICAFGGVVLWLRG